MFRKTWQEHGGELTGGPRGVVSTALHRSDDAYQPGVGAVQPRGIPHEQRLIRVLIGDHAPAALVPIQDDLTLGPFLNDVMVDPR